MSADLLSAGSADPASGADCRCGDRIGFAAVEKTHSFGKWLLQVWVDLLGVVQGECSECLFPAIGAGADDELPVA
ncbi:MAG: hypothetical protein K0R33_4201 [Mycobacterium sp.]|nr:hypothetical protein [Mycobacterium sp.]